MRRETVRVPQTDEGAILLRFRQSLLKTWGACALQAKFKDIDGLPRTQGSKASFGTVIHAALDHYNRTGDLEQAIHLFLECWDDPSILNVVPDVWNKYTTFGGLRQRGVEILKNYDEQQKWDSRKILFSEHRFLVPFGKHELEGTVDLGEIKKNHRGKEIFRIGDYKTTTRRPNLGGLLLDIQFTCLDPQTLVLLADMTWKPIGDIEVGDHVLGFDEHPTIQAGDGSRGRDAIVRPLRRWRDAGVTAVMTVEDEAFRLVLSDGSHLVASASHRFLARRSGRWEWRTVQDLADCLFNSRRKSAGIEIARTVSPPRIKIDYGGMDYQAGYLAGITLGDGSVSGSGEGIQHPFWTLGIGKSDEVLLARVRAFALSFGIRLYPWSHEPDGRGWQRHTVVGLRTHARADVDALVAMDDGDSDSWKAGWLAGLYDTDGSIAPSALLFHQRDRSVLERVCRYAADLGFQAEISGGKIPYASLKGDRSVKAAFCSLIRPTLARKVEKMVGSTGRFFGNVRVLAIEPVGRRRLVDITTTTGTFVAEGVASHNCYIYASLQPEFWMGNGAGFPPVPNGEWWFQMLADIPRRGIWFHLWDNGKELDAGGRDEGDFGRLYRMCEEIERAVNADVYVPSIGEACQLCDYANGPCPVEIPTRAEYEVSHLEDEHAWL